MPSSEPEDQTRPAPEEAATPKADEPAWPPAEARPEEPAAEDRSSDLSGEKSAVAGAPAESILTKPEEPATAKPDQPEAEPQLAALAAEPKQEMGLSESTLHWLVDEDKPVEALPNDPGTAPHYDPRAPVAGRKRQVAVIGGAAILALAVAAVLHSQAAGHRADTAAPADEPAEVLTQRAETALSAGRSGEAMELAHLAISANPRLADAYVVVGKVQRDSGRLTESRDAYRKYLELAPIGTHAGEARAALAALPP